MASLLTGKFEYDFNENLVDFYKGLGIPEDGMPKAGVIREVAVEGNKIMRLRPHPTTLILDQEVEENDGENFKFMSTAKLEGNILTVRSKSVKGNFVLNRRYQFNEKGIMTTLTADKTDVVAKVYFKRV